MIFGTERLSMDNGFGRSILPNDFDATTYIPDAVMSINASPISKKKLNSMTRLPLPDLQSKDLKLLGASPVRGHRFSYIKNKKNLSNQTSSREVSVQNSSKVRRDL